MDVAIKEYKMTPGSFVGDFGGLGIMGSIILLFLPVTEISIIAPIVLSAATLLGQGIVWYSRYLDRKDRRRRFDNIASMLEKKLSEKIEDNTMTLEDTETYLKVLEKLDDIDKG